MILGKNVLPVCLLVLCFICTTYAQNPDSTKIVRLSGQSHIYSQISTGNAPYQHFPASFLNFRLSNQLEILGIPLQANVFLTTASSESRQARNQFTFGLDSRAIFNRGLNRRNKFLRIFPTIQIGNCHPSYSGLTLGNINLNGVNVEFNPGVFYAAFAKGRVSRSIENTLPVFQEYERNIIYGGLGIGKKDRSKFVLSVMHAEDDPNSLEADGAKYYIDPDTLVLDIGTFIHGLDSAYLYKKPKENYVASAELDLFLFNRKFNIKGQLAGSLVTENLNAFEFDIGQIPELISENLYFNTSSRIDYAYSINPSLNLLNTRINLQMDRIGPGFNSLGVPYIRNNRNSYKADVTQYFINKKIKLRAFYSHSRDMGTDYNPRQSRVQRYGFNTSAKIRKSVFLSVLIANYNANTLLDEIEVDHNALNISLTTGLRKKFGKTTSFTNVTASYQTAENDMVQGLNELENMSIVLTQMLNFRKPVVFAGSVGYTNNSSNVINRDIIHFNTKLSYSGIKFMNNSLAFSHARWGEEILNTKLTYKATFNFKKYGRFSVQLGWKNYKNTLSTNRDYSDIILRMGMIQRW